MRQQSETKIFPVESWSPLIVAVVGHRSIPKELEPELEKGVAQALSEISDAAGEAPVVLLDSLAEGADQLVARVAQRRHPNWMLVAPLPMSEEAYLREFRSDDGRTEYRRILDHDNTFRFDAEAYLGCEPADRPETAYRRTGQLLVTQAHVLVALWDGQEGLVGGTGETAATALQRGPTRRDGKAPAVDRPGGCFFYHVWAPNGEDLSSLQRAAVSVGTLQRKKPVDWAPPPKELHSEAPSEALFTAEELFDHVERLRDWERARLKSRNGFWASLFGKPSTTADSSSEESMRELLAPNTTGQRESGRELALDELTESARASARHFCEIDSLAKSKQATSRRYARIGYSVITVGIVGLELGTGPLPEWGFVTVLGYTFAALAAVFWLRSWVRKDQAAYLNTRALAEMLRAAFYLEALEASSRFAVPDVNPQKLGLDFIRLAFGWTRMASFLRRQAANEPPSPVTQARLEAVDRAWFEGQIDYFRTRYQAEGRALRRWRFTRRALLAASVMTTAAAAVLMCVTGDWSSNPSLVQWLLFATVVGFLASNACKVYAEYRGYEEHQQRYAGMYYVFLRAHRRHAQLMAADPCDVQGTLDVFEEMAEVAVVENADWLAVHVGLDFEASL